MPTISKQKQDKISEQILHFLFSISPESKFTSQISMEIARDEEFTKALLLELEKKGLVALVNKNKDGVNYTKRQRWRLSSQAFSIYSSAQNKTPPSTNTLQNNNVYNLEDQD